MKASIHTEYGTPDVLQIQDIEKPVPGDKEILVRVFAATVNRTDCHMLSAKPFIMRFVTGMFGPKNPILGTDFGGRVEAVGAQVKDFRIGDRVFGFDDNGLSSHAEYLKIPEDKGLATIPDNITYEEAAASIEGTHYAYNFINKIKLKSGDKVLVNGATGSIGSAALQLLKYYGAEVTAVCSTENIELVKSLGADRVIDYLKEDFTQDGEVYNYVFDTVGKSSFGKCRRILKPCGVYISSELGWMAQNLLFAILTPLVSKLPGMKNARKVIFPIPLHIKESVFLVKKIIEEGRYQPVIDRRYSLDTIGEAFRYVETGQKIGNVIIIMKHE